MVTRPLTLLALVPLMVGCGSAPPAHTPVALRTQVEVIEHAFAHTMAERDLEAFAAFIADDAVFLGGSEPLRGKEAVVAAWSRYFEDPGAPFFWEPDRVEVIESGRLALSTGPVYAPDGTVFARFTSIWRLDPGGWRIVFDLGTEACGDD